MMISVGDENFLTQLDCRAQHGASELMNCLLCFRISTSGPGTAETRLDSAGRKPRSGMYII